eukprot:235179-Rhodomonas_salina.1
MLSDVRHGSCRHQGSIPPGARKTSPGPCRATSRCCVMSEAAVVRACCAAAPCAALTLSHCALHTDCGDYLAWVPLHVSRSVLQVSPYAPSTPVSYTHLRAHETEADL